MNTTFRPAASTAAARCVAALAAICTTAVLLVSVVSLSDPAINDPAGVQAKARAAAQVTTLASAQSASPHTVR